MFMFVDVVLCGLKDGWETLIVILIMIDTETSFSLCSRGKGLGSTGGNDNVNGVW